MKLFYDIVVVGAGGTGGNLIKELGRFLKFFNRVEVGWCLSIVDGDIVEAKNTARQPFSSYDIQQKKAAVMHSGLTEYFGLSDDSVKAYPFYLDEVSQLEQICGKRPVNAQRFITVLVGAVDNHRARQVMEDFFQSKSDIIYIDSANEFDFGEICIGIRLRNKQICPPRSFYFPEVLTDRSLSASEQSCGVINQSSPQHIVTNILAACHCLGFISNLMQNDILQGGIFHFNSFTGFSRFDQWVEPVKEKKKNRTIKTVQEGGGKNGK